MSLTFLLSVKRVYTFLKNQDICHLLIFLFHQITNGFKKRNSYLIFTLLFLSFTYLYQVWLFYLKVLFIHFFLFAQPFPCFKIPLFLNHVTATVSQPAFLSLIFPSSDPILFAQLYL